MSSVITRLRGSSSLLVLLVLALAIPIIANRLIVVPKDPAVKEYVKQLETHRKGGKAQFYLVGNSMLDSRLSGKQLRQLTDIPFALIIRGGSASAFWYLALKNYALAARNKPQTVVVFFRDRELTQPLYRTGGQYKQWLDGLKSKDGEKEFKKILRRAGGLSGRITRAEQHLFPLLPFRAQLNGEIRSLAAVLFTKESHMKKVQNEIFDPGNFRKSLSTELAEFSDADFQEELEASFLPPMLRIAKERGINLVFYRVRRRAISEGHPEKSAVTVYVNALTKYLQSEGARVIDETNDARVTGEMFADGDHIAKSFKQQYTGYIWERIAPYVQAPPATSEAIGSQQ